MDNDDLKIILNKSESLRKSMYNLSDMSGYKSAVETLSKSISVYPDMSGYKSVADALRESIYSLSDMSGYKSAIEALSKSMSVYDRLIYKNSTIEFPEIKNYSLDGVTEVNEAILNNELVFEKIGNEISSSLAFKERKIQTQAILKMGDDDGNIALDYLTDKRTEASLDRTILSAVQKHFDKIKSIPLVKIFNDVTTFAGKLIIWGHIIGFVYKGPSAIFPWCEPQALPLFNEQAPAITYFMGDRYRYYYEAPIIIGNDVLTPPISNVASKDIEAKSADITEDK